MTALPTSTSPARRISDSVDVFGVRWPRYKVEALVVGVVALIVILTLTALAGVTSAAPAVLGATGVTVVAWWALRAARTRR
ncbi:hypothetical protein [Tsukamurella soli]|uniref:MYXO-CTERM domain-containing protein n=1 Tax=Tsukamurella soli TaxID=644556 RepID=A0ABP8J0W2_9ACTN